MYNRTLVRAPYPFGFIGDGVTRIVVLALPTLQVRSFLPAGLELGKQNFSPAGTHPVVLLFHDFVDCQFSLPTLLEPMKFHEQTFGIPFTCISASRGFGSWSGPYYYMPMLYLDSSWVLTVGRNLWGFEKRAAAVTLTGNSYSLTGSTGRRIASLAWSECERGTRPVSDGAPDFDPVRELLNQNLISLFPPSTGPFLTLTDFDRRWNLASLRRIEAELEISPAYLPGFAGGRFASAGAQKQTDAPMPAAYELSGPWWLSYPYPAPGMVPVAAGVAAGPAAHAWYS